MDDVNRTPENAPVRRRKPYPRHKIVAALERAETDGVVEELGNAGFARDRIDIFTAEDVRELDEPIGGSGLRGFLTRLNLSLGADLDEFERSELELSSGHALVLVEVHGGAEHERAYDVLRRHGGHSMRYYGRWTIAVLESDDQ